MPCLLPRNTERAPTSVVLRTYGELILTLQGCWRHPEERTAEAFAVPKQHRWFGPIGHGTMLGCPLPKTESRSTDSEQALAEQHNFNY